MNNDLFGAFPGARQQNGFIPPPSQAQAPPWSAPPGAPGPQSGWPNPTFGPSTSAGNAPAPHAPWPPTSPWQASSAPWNAPSSPWHQPTSWTAPLHTPASPSVWDPPPFVSAPPISHSYSAPVPNWLAPPPQSPFARPASAGATMGEGPWGRQDEPPWAQPNGDMGGGGGGGMYQPMFFAPPNSAGLHRSISAPWSRSRTRGTDAFSEDNLAKRPRDWRDDYTAPSLRGRFRFPLRARSRSRSMSVAPREAKCTISPYLDTGGQHNISYDLRHPPSPSIPQITLFQLALLPPLQSLSLTHPLLPWSIPIRASTPSGITISDLLLCLYEELQEPIRHGEYYTDALGGKEREALGRAAAVRCAGDSGLLGRGVLRVDFLGEECIFAGIVGGRKGWELTTRQG